jgi:hypothetical protein
MEQKNENIVHLDSIGKHYLFSSKLDHSLKRHYTVSNCMRRDIYLEYENAISQALNG